MSILEQAQPFIDILHSLILVSEQECSNMLERCEIKSLAKKEIVHPAGQLVNEVYFVLNGVLRFCINDTRGQEHSTYFAMENAFIADYTSIINHSPAMYTMQALEESKVLVIPQSTLEWCFQNMQEGEKMVRLIRDYYFVYLDTRLQHMYTHTPKERYDLMNSIFPNIQKRIPQHMIASYIGITPVHLSRLKKEGQSK